MKRITRTFFMIVQEVEERSSSIMPAAPIETDGEEIPAVLRPSLARCSNVPPKMAVGER
jgi:hypothetical protein